jgi:hypothetical protein
VLRRTLFVTRCRLLHQLVIPHGSDVGLARYGADHDEAGRALSHSEDPVLVASEDGFVVGYPGPGEPDRGVFLIVGTDFGKAGPVAG